MDHHDLIVCFFIVRCDSDYIKNQIGRLLILISPVTNKAEGY